MRRALRWFGTGLLFLVVALALLAALLDRKYYDGPVSDHYDGERFFNPGAPTPARPASRMLRFFTGAGQAKWPERVGVIPVYAPANATRCQPYGGVIFESRRRCVEQVDPRLMVATWIGHATVLVQAGGLNILTDPIFAERASPVGFVGPKRVRAPGIPLAALPKIDLIVISHNHYDHMDIESLRTLWYRDKPMIVTSLGNDTILRRSGIESVAGDWGSHHQFGDWSDPPCLGPNGCDPPFPRGTVTVERNQHWSSRYGTDRYRALWSSFRIETPAGAIHHAGDTGLGDGSWAVEAARRGPIRLAILPIGAYEPRDVMKENHVNPAEAVRIFDALKPAMALGVHWGTFQLTFESIDAPPKELARVRGSRRFVATEVGRSIVVPEIGVR